MWFEKHKKKRHLLTFLYTFTDTVRFLEEVVMVALATTVQEVFACSCFLVKVPAWERGLARSYDWSCSTWIYSDREQGQT